MSRPSIKITDEVCRQAESFAAQGLIMEQIADCLGMGDRTLYEKQQAYPQLAQSIKSGRAKGIAKVTNALFTSATGGNLGAQVFYLKNRAGWRDKIETEHSGIMRVNIDSDLAKVIRPNK